jgi:membrane protease YdiL (CAAX protease family)
LVYQVGILLSGGVQNGADFVTRLLFSALSGDPSRYLMVNLAVAVAYVAVVSWLRRERRIDVRRFGRTVGESLAYAVTMGTAIALVMTRVLGLDPRLAALAQGAGGAVSVVRGPFDALVMACGAGVHEELVFRVLLLTGVAWVLEAVMGMGRAVAWLAALAVSSVLFSAAHHIGPLGDQLRLWVFVYRVLAGAVFGLLYQLRGLAVAVYTHTLYDLYVFVIA